MVDAAEIKLWGKWVGAVLWDEETQTASFQYDKNFLRSGWEVSPIKMPLKAGEKIHSFPELRIHDKREWNTFKGMPGLLADVLPDKYGNQLINLWLTRNGRPVNSLNPVEMLCFIGSRGMGALEFEPTQFPKKPTSFDVELSSLVDVASKMLSNRDGFETNLTQNEQKAMSDILKIGTSAGGARPKAIIAYNAKTGQVKSGQTEVPEGFEHWMIKLDGVNDEQFGESKGYGRVEMAYYLMAKDCGIDMMESRLLEENGRAHFMTKRFDRGENNEKYHIQTFCAMQHYDFNEVNSYSYEQLFQTMRQLRLSYPQAEQIYRRMVFNVLARNCDDHTKNTAFRMKNTGIWELAPAYDICYAYRPDSIWVRQHALSIRGKRQHITKMDFLELAEEMNIKKASQILQQINEVVLRWKQYASEVKVPSKIMETIAKNVLANPSW